MNRPPQDTLAILILLVGSCSTMIFLTLALVEYFK
jgi:hypothetical protein